MKKPSQNTQNEKLAMKTASQNTHSKKIGDEDALPKH